MSGFARAEFSLTVAATSLLPAPLGKEIAFAGRSNAGKSSAINALTERRQLAYVARQPGKTQTIQFYRLAPERYLVDLPGYGYARVPERLRRNWARLLEHYLAQRASLVGLLLIMDIRHPLTGLDEEFLNWFLSRRVPVHILLSKADKLSASAAAIAEAQVNQALKERGLPCTVQLFSSARRIGVEAAQQLVRRWLDMQDDRPGSAEGEEILGGTNKNPRLKGSKAGGKMP